GTPIWSSDSAVANPPMPPPAMITRLSVMAVPRLCASYIFLIFGTRVWSKPYCVALTAQCLACASQDGGGRRSDRGTSRAGQILRCSLPATAIRLGTRFPLETGRSPFQAMLISEPGGMLPMDESAAARPEEVGLCSRRVERVAAWMQRQVADGRLAGVEV